LAAQIDDFKRAIELYEKIGQQSLETDLGKWSANEYFYKAALCQFAQECKSGECNDTKEAVERYVDLHPAFENSRECKFLRNIIEAFNANDVEKFTDVVFKYDSIIKLTPWESRLLLRIKEVVRDGITAPAADLDSSKPAAGQSAAVPEDLDDPLDKLT